MASTATHHWIITAEHKGQRATANGVGNYPPGTPRAAAYEEITKYIADALGASNVNVLFFELAPAVLA